MGMKWYPRVAQTESGHGSPMLLRASQFGQTPSGFVVSGVVKAVRAGMATVRRFYITTRQNNLGLL